jgi:hypothetical protein
MNYIFPVRVLKLATMLSGREFGSECFIARNVIAGEYAEDPGLVLAWLVDLSIGVDTDRRAKGANVKKYARIAARDLAEEFLRTSDPSMTPYRQEAATLCCEKFLSEIGVKF